MRATAAVVTSPGGPFVLEEIEVDEPRSDEVVVEIAYSGMCHTDLLFRDSADASFPAVLGHEGVGRVVASGSAVDDLDVGDLVVMSEHFCGQCVRCRNQLTPYCTDSYARDGGRRPDGSRMLSSPTRGQLAGAFLGQSSFATHVLTKARTAVRIPDDLDLAAVAPMACAGMTGAGAVVNVLRPSAGASIAVFGAGAVGLSGLLAAVAIGCDPIVVMDVVPSRLELALRPGATHALDGRREDPAVAVHALTAGGADFALEASGVPVAAAQAVRSIGPLGHCTVAGVGPRDASLDVPWHALLRGQTISGSVMGSSDPRELLPRLVDLHRSGRYDTGAMVEVFPFEQINEAAAASLAGDVVKPVLSMAP